jgi:hypothetical protein
MSQLEDKLAEILNRARRDQRPDARQLIPEIKQAFADEDEFELTGMTFEDANNTTMKFRKPSATPVMTKEEWFKKYSPDTPSEELMTGAYWLERFEKELYKPKPQVLPGNTNNGGESHDRFFRAGGTNFMYRKAIEAAKKAAGIKEK